MTDQTLARVTRARHLAQLAEDERDGYIDPLGQSRRRVARRVIAGDGALAAKIRDVRGARHGLLWHLT